MVSFNVVEMKLFEDDFERYKAFCRKHSLSLMEGLSRLMKMAKVPSTEVLLAEIERSEKRRGGRKSGKVHENYLLYLADEGDSSAFVELAVLYYLGNGVSRNYSKAAFWAEKAASAGERAGEIFLGLMYCLGKGVKRDFSKARELLSSAREFGEPLCMVMAGFACLRCALGNNDVPKSENPLLQEAFSWFLQAAEMRNAEAGVLTGWCYLHGVGVSKDVELGKTWIKRGIVQDGDVLKRFGCKVPDCMTDDIPDYLNLIARPKRCRRRLRIRGCRAWMRVGGVWLREEDAVCRTRSVLPGIFRPKNTNSRCLSLRGHGRLLFCFFAGSK